MKGPVAIVVAAALVLNACSTNATEALVSFEDETCSSSDMSNRPEGSTDILLVNSTDTRTALIVGTYNDGFERADLLDYGTDISTRPQFITALKIFESAPNSTTTVQFDPGPGTYFMVCMPSPNTMVVLDDLTISR